MKNAKINIVFFGKSFNTEFCTGTLHTNNPKVF